MRMRDVTRSDSLIKGRTNQTHEIVIYPHLCRYKKGLHSTLYEVMVK